MYLFLLTKFIIYAMGAPQSSAGNEFAGRTIGVILPDAGERCLSTVLFDHVGG
jgi:hypothetical protein